MAKKIHFVLILCSSLAMMRIYRFGLLNLLILRLILDPAQSCIIKLIMLLTTLIILLSPSCDSKDSSLVKENTTALYRTEWRTDSVILILRGFENISVGKAAMKIDIIVVKSGIVKILVTPRHK